MNFRTQIPIKNKSNNLIDYRSKTLLLGSCFSENIAKKLSYYKFYNHSNPFGILFHPVAIENLIANAVNQKKYTEKDTFHLNERWHCFDAHSEFSNTSKKDLIESLNAQISLTNKSLLESTHLIITLGTSWVYRFLASDTIVANCHKVPQKKFLKELLSITEIVSSLENIICLIKSINSKIEIIFTVSPVRHLKDGFTENALSKAHLTSAIHQVVEPRNHIHYFPAFEIMMDDLREYRFYNADMVHPNETAIKYIWKQFKTVWIHQEAAEIMQEVETIQKGLAHKPFNEKSNQHQVFLVDLELKITNLKESHHIDF